jgi:hypothetical protein
VKAFSRLEKQAKYIRGISMSEGDKSSFSDAFKANHVHPELAKRFRTSHARQRPCKINGKPACRKIGIRFRRGFATGRRSRKIVASIAAFACNHHEIRPFAR